MIQESTPLVYGTYYELCLSQELSKLALVRKAMSTGKPQPSNLSWYYWCNIYESNITFNLKMQGVSTCG